MANKLIITESQFKRLKHLLMETPLNRFISSSANEGDLIQISVGDKKSIFKVVEVYKGFEISMVGLSDDVNKNQYVMRNNSLKGNKLNLYYIDKDIDINPMPKIEDWPTISVKPDKLELFRDEKIIDSADIKQTAIVDPNSTLGDYTDDNSKVNPNLTHVGQDEISPEIPLGGSGNMPTGDAVVDDTEEENPENEGVPEDEENETDLIKKYYKEIMADENLKQAFYKAPNMLNYFVSAMKGEKAEGDGIYKAMQLVDSHKEKNKKEKAPGFTELKNKWAKFRIKNTIEIPYTKIKNKQKVRDTLSIYPRDYLSAIVQQKATVGNEAIVSLTNKDYNFKIDVIDTTDNPNIFECYFSVYKIPTVENNYWYSGNVLVEFLESDGYVTQTTNNQTTNK
jgi:hypothetical protein